MNDCMTFPDTVEEFMEQYKVVDTEHIYTNGSEFVPIFRMKQWFEHLPSAQPYTIHSDGRLWVTVDDIDKVNAVVVDESKSKFCKQFYMDAQPERKTGRWLPDNTDYYRTRFICSVCGESEEVPTMGFGYAPMWGYCPNCGADMRGDKYETN